MAAVDPTVPSRLKPRKSPAQSRSAATVAAIREATIQVLLSTGALRFTTTRVAERAGVSVGTLYQYFPNKQSLLYAVLLSHFEDMAVAIEEVRAEQLNGTILQLADSIAHAYVSVKMAKPEATAALYSIAVEINQVRLSGDAFDRIQAATVALLESASDASFTNPKRVAFTLMAVLAGITRSSFSSLPGAHDALHHLPGEAKLLARAYLLSASDKSPS